MQTMTKVIAKNKLLKHNNNKLNDEILELKMKLQRLEKGKESIIECKECLVVKNENKQLKEEIIRFEKFENSSQSLSKIISSQRIAKDKTGLGYDSTEASTSKSKNVKFEGETSELKPLEIKPKYILLKDRLVHIASDEEIKSLRKLSLKPEVDPLKPKLRSKIPPPRKPNSPHPRSKTPQPRINQNRRNFQNNHQMWKFNPWRMIPPYLHPSQMHNVFGPNNFGQMRQWGLTR